MLLTIVGLILLASPLLLICKFSNKNLGFAYVLSFFLAGHLLIAILTQAFHIFTYQVVLVANLVVFLSILIIVKFYRFPVFIFKGLAQRENNIFQKLIPFLSRNLVPILFIIIALTSFYFVHYNYSGKYSIAVTPEYQEAKNMEYTYPYFADEWYSVAFIKDSINSHSLPLENPLTRSNSSFVNFEFPFHSFLSELFLLLNLNPLTKYTAFTIFSGLLICILIYIFLRGSGIEKLPSAVAGLSALYLTNGANLPGLWTLIPCILGIISILLGFLFILYNKRLATLLSTILILLFYPPLFPFYSLAIIIYFALSKDLTRYTKIKNIIYYLALSFLAGVIISIAYLIDKESFSNFILQIKSKLFYPTLTGEFNPQFPIFSIVPLISLLLFAIGIFPLVKRKLWLAAPLFAGLIFWIMYSLTTFRIVIEYERVVVFTSILIIIASGFGLNYLLKALKELDFLKNNNILKYAQIVILILFLILSFQYTKRDKWKDLKAYNPETDQFFIPAAVANNYLQPDDLKLFRNIKNKRFLSYPWKGTVMGIATNNYPVTTKAGTITINPDLFYKFKDSGCKKKIKIADSKYIKFVYSSKFDCPQFEFIDKSNEGLYLYKFKSLKEENNSEEL